jgi:hypothetical protein
MPGIRQHAGREGAFRRAVLAALGAMLALSAASCTDLQLRQYRDEPYLA